MPTRNASAVWEGGLKTGKGSFKGESGSIGGAYSFATRFGDTPGSNPEELLAAAEAACYSMALSGGLEKNGTPATKIETSAACTIEQGEGGFSIKSLKLDVKASVPGIENAKFQEIATATKSGCPVSKALSSSVDVQLTARLV